MSLVPSNAQPTPYAGLGHRRLSARGAARRRTPAAGGVASNRTVYEPHSYGKGIDPDIDSAGCLAMLGRCRRELVSAGRSGVVPLDAPPVRVWFIRKARTVTSRRHRRCLPRARTLGPKGPSDS
jgi:hypothetical protein